MIFRFKSNNRTNLDGLKISYLRSKTSYHMKKKNAQRPSQGTLDQSLYS